ncbi:hypothetical protein [uncultured Psychrobacter sp.]|uniref:hypothetical protein n=1 Tax=uncultured Psychrobacter sp. TaxID=259303 RepID=UPI00261BFB5B|nr:hypothetical protein [uncultured Psychrobacter sp.]
MKIMTIYIENDRAEIVQTSGECVHECIYIPDSCKADLMINRYDDWSVELDEDEVEFLIRAIGEFKAYTITWKSDISLYRYIFDLSDKLDFIIDNDNGSVKNGKEITAMNLNEFSNWIS